MMELLDAGEALPFPVEGSAVYYVGPTPERPGQIIRLRRAHHQRPDGRLLPPPAGPGAGHYDRQGARNQAVKGGGGPQRRSLSGRPGRRRALMAASVGGAGGHLLGGPGLRGGAPPDGTGPAPDGDPGRPRRRPVRERPGGLSVQPVTPSPICLHL